MRNLIVPLCLLLALAGTRPASAAGEDRRLCIDAGDVNGWSVVDDRTIDLTLGNRETYRVTLGVMAEAAALGSASRIGVRGDSLGRLCERFGVILADGVRIPVRSISPLPRPAAAEAR